MTDYTQIVKPFSEPEKRAEALWSGGSFEQKDKAAAAAETQKPLHNIVSSTRSALGSLFLDLPKNVIKKTLGTTASIATNTIAVPANIGRWALDLLRVPPRILAVGTDTLSRATFGNISRIANKTNQKVQNALGNQN